MGDSDKAGTVKVIYVLYLVGLVTGGLAGIVGVVMAYVNQGDGPEWLASHYEFQIRTFWIGLLFMIVGGILLFIVVGGFVYLFWVVWLIIRCVKGIKYLDNEEAHPNPQGWGFS
jgi:uncharacterized membrane protein